MLIECTWITTRWGSTACIAVSMEGRIPFLEICRGADFSALCTVSLASASSIGMRISSWFARASHLPDPLIQRIPSSFIDVLPLLACTSKGSLPTRADSWRRQSSSLSTPVEENFRWTWFFKIYFALCSMVPQLASSLCKIGNGFLV